jgi:hypothetical protein
MIFIFLTEFVPFVPDIWDIWDKWDKWDNWDNWDKWDKLGQMGQMGQKGQRARRQARGDFTMAMVFKYPIFIARWPCKEIENATNLNRERQDDRHFTG